MVSIEIQKETTIEGNTERDCVVWRETETCKKRHETETTKPHRAVVIPWTFQQENKPKKLGRRRKRTRRNTDRRRGAEVVEQQQKILDWRLRKGLWRPAPKNYKFVVLEEGLICCLDFNSAQMHCVSGYDSRIICYKCSCSKSVAVNQPKACVLHLL